jgi:hypothetical protein
MQTEISIAQMMSLGALIAGAAFLLFLLVVGYLFVRKVTNVAGRFKSVGAERVNGVIQMRGVFDDEQALLPDGARLSTLKSALRNAVDFSPSPEDLQREAEIERNAAGAGGPAN